MVDQPVSLTPHQSVKSRVGCKTHLLRLEELALINVSTIMLYWRNRELNRGVTHTI
jgi:hypothetical protein